MITLWTANGSQRPTEELDKNIIALVMKLQMRVDLDARPVFVKTMTILGFC